MMLSELEEFLVRVCRTTKKEYHFKTLSHPFRHTHTHSHTHKSIKWRGRNSVAWKNYLRTDEMRTVVQSFGHYCHIRIWELSRAREWLGQSTFLLSVYKKALPTTNLAFLNMNTLSRHSSLCLTSIKRYVYQIQRFTPFRYYKIEIFSVK